MPPSMKHRFPITVTVSEQDEQPKKYPIMENSIIFIIIWCAYDMTLYIYHRYS